MRHCFFEKNGSSLIVKIVFLLCLIRALILRARDILSDAVNIGISLVQAPFFHVIKAFFSAFGQIINTIRGSRQTVSFFKEQGIFIPITHSAYAKRVSRNKKRILKIRAALRLC